MLILFLLLLLSSIVCGIVLLVRAVMKKSCKALGLVTLGMLAMAFLSLGLSMSNDKLEAIVLLSLIYFSAVSLVLAIIGLVRRILKKPCRTYFFVSLGLFAGCIFLIFVFFGFMLSLGEVALLSSLFCGALAILSLLIWIVLTVLKKKSRFFLIATPLCLILCVSLFSWYYAITTKKQRDAHEHREVNDVKVKVDYDFVVEDGAEPLEIKYYEENELFGWIHVYDEEYLNMLLKESDVTAEDCRHIIQTSTTISDKFKPYFIDFTDRMERKYPDIPFEILYHNLQTLRVEELPRWQYDMKSLSFNSQGCYVMPENAIYIPEGTEYIEGGFGFQVLIHEFCHAARTSWMDGKGRNKVTVKSDLDMTILGESLNSEFSCSLLNYYEWDIAYQVCSNYLRIMLECMDNYDISDYMKHSDTYFLSKLDEYSGYTNYATVIWKLITLQRSDYDEGDRIDIPAEEYFPIYDFLCELYYKKYITAEMSDEDMTKIADDLVYKAFYDAPEDYKINTKRFYENLENYKAELQANMIRK